MHALWKGSISFGLVNIPVKIYSASREKELKFEMLHKKDHAQIRYARICKAEEKEVPWEEIIKAYEYHPGEYIIFNEEDFKKINADKMQTIEIVDFVKEEEVDSVYYAKPYFLEPEKGGSSAYLLLRDALRKSKKVGIAKFILHHREHIAVIKPYHNSIILNQLRYADEMLSTDELKIPPKEKTSLKELEIALKLIDHLTTTFVPDKYEDTYREEIKQIIAQKAKGKKIRSQKEAKHPSKVLDIMELLKASLEQTNKKTRKRNIA